MTDKDEFGFLDEEPSKWDGSPLPEPEEEPAVGGRPAGAGGKGSRTRLMLLALLLVALGGAGYYFYAGRPAPPPPAPPAKKKPVALPAPPPPQATAPAKAPPAVQPAAAGPAPAAVREAAKPEAAAAAATAKPLQPPPAPAKVEAKPAPAVAVAPAPPAAAKAEAKPVAAAAPVKAETKAPPATGPYFLHAGAYVLHDNLAAAERIVRRLGFEPRVQQVRRPEPVTRLRVGTYPAADAEARLREVKALSPDAFTLPQEGQVTVYAASYFDLDQARRFADRLYGKGLRVEEEAARVTLPVSMLSFGSFSDRQAAEQAAARARKAGLEATVGKRR
jgi:hypothetical protein